MRGGSRIAELDGLRGAAILMVLVWHFVGEIIDTSLGPWAWWTAKVTILGRTGVDLFFVLSGFLITDIILSRTRSPMEFLRAFYLRRALRIFPPYLLLVAVFLAFQEWGDWGQAFGNEIPLWRLLTFTQTWWMAQNGLFGPPGISVTWSVSVEEHYYLIFPLLMMAAPKRWIPHGLLLLAGASALLRAWFHFGLGLNHFYSYVFPPSRLDALALGGLLAWAWKQEWWGRWSERRAGDVRRTAFGLLAGLPVVAWALHRDLAYHMYSWGHSYLAIMYLAILTVIVIHVGHPALSLLRGRILRHVGRVSYSLYLFHPVALLVFFSGAGQVRIRTPYDAVLSVLALATSILFCSVLFVLVERRCTSLGRRHAY